MFELMFEKQAQPFFILNKFFVSVLISFLLVVLSSMICDCQPPLMGKYLYTASIQYRFNETYCTGAIVAEVLVLTTCDCVSTYDQDNGTRTNRPPFRIVVVVGVLDLFTDIQRGQIRQGKAIWRHPNCEVEVRDREWTNLAIIEVNKPFLFKEFNSNVAEPIEVFASWQAFKLKSLLIFMSNSPPKDCYTVGWGFTTDNTSVPTSRMQEIPLKLKKRCVFNNCDMEFCKVNYSVQPNICGQLGMGRCGGFTGNLLVCFGKVYGLVSIPSNCSKRGRSKKMPTVFVRMDEGLLFIWSVLKSLGYSRGTSVSPQEFQFFLLSAPIMMYFKRSRIFASKMRREP